jgi:hypothetical protein
MAESQPAIIERGEQAPCAISSHFKTREAAVGSLHINPSGDKDKVPRLANTEALGKAMENVRIHGDTMAGAPGGGTTDADTLNDAVRVDPRDVILLVSTAASPQVNLMLITLGSTVRYAEIESDGAAKTV